MAIFGYKKLRRRPSRAFTGFETGGCACVPKKRKQERGGAKNDAGCCMECHLHYEEDALLPHLPPYYANYIRKEHRRLAAMGYPPAEVKKHTQEEEIIYRSFLPPKLYREVHRQHLELDELDRRRMIRKIRGEREVTNGVRR
jgi:hypothetical protein